MKSLKLLVIKSLCACHLALLGSLFYCTTLSGATLMSPYTFTAADFAAGDGMTSYTTTVCGTTITVTAGNDTPGRAPELNFNAANTEFGVFSNNEDPNNAQSYTINSNKGNQEWIQFDITAASGSPRYLTTLDFRRIQSTVPRPLGADVTVTSLSTSTSTQFYVNDNAPKSFPSFADIPGLSAGSTGLRIFIRNADDVQIGLQDFTLIPEPSRALLLGLGAFALIFKRQRN